MSETQIILSKCELIDAVLTEPLIRGRWLERHGIDMTLENACDSNVCAVGAILRNMVSPLTMVSDYQQVCAAACAYNMEGGDETNYFARLVNFFDRAALSGDYKGFDVPAEERWKVANYIAETFPDNIRVSSTQNGDPWPVFQWGR